MVPEIENSRTYNLRTRVILAWMRIMERKKTPSKSFPWRIRCNFYFWKNFDFEGVSPYTNWSISIPRFRRYLRTDSTQATQKFQHRDTIMWKYFFFGNSKLLPFYGIKSEFNHFISMTVNFPPSIAYAHVHLLWWQLKYGVSKMVELVKLTNCSDPLSWNCFRGRTWLWKECSNQTR